MDSHNQMTRDPYRIAAAVAIGLLVILLFGFPALALDRQEPAVPAQAGSAIQAQAVPVLDIAKVADQDPVPAGQVLMYTITGTVTEQPANGVVVTDWLPARTTFVDCAPVPCQLVGSAVEWDLGLVHPGDNPVLTLYVTVDPPLYNGTVLTNTATISAASGVPQTATITTHVLSSHDLAITKTASAGTVVPGETLAYTLTVEVAGTEPADGLVITDELPPYVGPPTCSPSCTVTNNIARWQRSTLVPGIYHFTLSVQVSSPLTNGLELVNTASITDADGHQASDGTTTVVQSTVSLVVSKSVSPAAVWPGGEVTYTILVTNLGNTDAKGVNIVDTLPLGFSPPTRQWPSVRVNAGDTWTQTVTATAGDADGIYSNLVTITWNSHVTATGPTAPVLVDGTPPVSTLALPLTMTNQSPIVVAWSTLDPAPSSGIETTCLYWKKKAAVPGAWQLWACKSGASGTFNFAPASDGIYFLATSARDLLNNEEPLPAGYGSHRLVYDTTRPDSTATSPPTSTVGTPIHIPWHVVEGLSGVDRVALWYRYGSPTWQDSGLAFTGLLSTTRDGAFTFDQAAQPGTYYFEVLALDRAGNEELAASGTGDTATRVEPAVIPSYPVHLPLVMKGYIAPVLKLTLSKTANPAVAGPGDPLVYTLVVANEGTVPTNVNLVDNPLPAQTAFLPGSANGCSYTAANGITWSGDLAAGASHTCSFTVIVNPTAAGTIHNTAAAAYGTPPQSVSQTTETPVLNWHAGQGLAGKVVYNVQVCPDNCDVVLAGTESNGVWKSTDGGATWQQTWLQGRMVWSVAVQPGTGGQTAYAATWGNSIWKTTDGGGSWFSVKKNLPEDYLYSVIVAPDGVVYVGTYSHGVYKSLNGGSQWLAAGLGTQEVDALAASSPPGETILYAGTWGDGLWKSTDGGAIWTQKNIGNSYIYAIAVDPSNQAVVYAATYGGIYRSADHGETWAPELASLVVYSVAVAQDGTAYLGTEGQGIYRRSPAGQWQPMTAQPYTAATVNSVAVRPEACTRQTQIWLGTTDGTWWYGVE